MKKLAKKISILGLIALMVLSLSAPASAVGVGIGPSELTIANALRGGEYTKTITIVNPGQDESTINLTTEGEAGEWLSLYKIDDLTKPVEELSIAGKGRSTIKVKIDIPPDVSSGTYTATIFAKTAHGKVEDAEVGVGTALRVPVSVTIEVTGTQILTGIVKHISARDTEVHYPLRIEVLFQNTGNVVAKPTIKTAITQKGSVIYSFDHTYEEVRPGALDTLSAEWDTTGMEVGDYGAQVTVSLNNEVLATQELSFKLLPVGTLSRQGDLTEITYEGKPSVGKIIKILAGFENTGEIDTRAKFIGEVYMNGDLIDTIESEELLVPVRNTGTLATYLEIETPGSYTIKGHAIYKGKTTSTKELAFDAVSELETEETESKSFLEIPDCGALGAALAIAFVSGYLRRRRRSM